MICSSLCRLPFTDVLLSLGDPHCRLAQFWGAGSTAVNAPSKIENSCQGCDYRRGREGTREKD